MTGPTYLVGGNIICAHSFSSVWRDLYLQNDCAHARASSVFFFKRQYNCHVDLTRFPCGAHRRRRFVICISRKFFVLCKIWLAARRLIAILSLVGPPRDPKIALHYHFRRRISHSNTILRLYLTDYKYGIQQMFLTENNKSADLDQSINQSVNLFMSIRGMGLSPEAHEWNVWQYNSYRICQLF